MKFKYRSGQQPLDGFTLKRGVGKGGFGEVYFAVSDGGKEVALKLLLGHSEVELRGIANCLNMKHPNLVHVYDLREDSEGQQWLVMEYVLGESMSAVLNRHPTGLPLSLTKEWFAALARAVGHLHDSVQSRPPRRPAAYSGAHLAPHVRPLPPPVRLRRCAVYRRKPRRPAVFSGARCRSGICRTA